MEFVSKTLLSNDTYMTRILPLKKRHVKQCLPDSTETIKSIHNVLDILTVTQ